MESSKTETLGTILMWKIQNLGSLDFWSESSPKQACRTARREFAAFGAQ